MPLTNLKASLVLCNVPTTNSDAARRFYGRLLGVDTGEFARGLNDRVESYFIPLSEDGIDLTITQRFTDEERLTCYFAVENLDAALAELTETEAKVVAEPQQIYVGPERAKRFFQKAAERQGLTVGDSIGRLAVLLDPDGNHVGILELEEVAQAHFKVGKYAQQLSDARVAEHREAREAGADV